MSNHLIGPVTPGNTSNDDAILFRRAVRERWPISDEARSRWMARLGLIIEHGDDRQAVSALKAAASFDAINQRDELAAEYMQPGGLEGTSRILSPAEVAQMMDQSIPQEEYRTEPAEKVWPTTPIPAAPPLVSLLPDSHGSGAGTSTPAG